MRRISSVAGNVGAMRKFRFANELFTRWLRTMVSGAGDRKDVRIAYRALSCGRAANKAGDRVCKPRLTSSSVFRAEKPVK
jgi:hypothetical protein